MHHCHGGGVTTTPAPATTVQPNPAGVAQAKADSVRHPYTQADVQFMYNMIGHHAQAVVMSNWAPTHDASPSVRVLAERIINAQQDEIGTMQRWLRDRLKPVPEASGIGKMMMNGVEHDMLMPGMLTDDQMKQLDAARGKEFDRLFLTFMLQHHRGAVTMVKELSTRTEPHRTRSCSSSHPTSTSISRPRSRACNECSRF